MGEAFRLYSAGRQFEDPYGRPVFGSITVPAPVRSPRRCAALGTIACAIVEFVFRRSCTVKKTNCFGFGLVRCGMYGVPVKLATNALVSEGGLATGVPVTEKGIASSALSEPL